MGRTGAVTSPSPVRVPCPAGCRRTAERVLADVAAEYNLIQSEVEDLWAAPTRPTSS